MSRPDPCDLSIVIVSWNTRELLLRCLESVMGGVGGLRVQIVVVDNGSSDGSADAVAAVYPDVELLRESENRGFAAANNLALAHVRGRHVLLLNSDTVVRCGVLESMVRYADAHPEVGVVGCRLVHPNGTRQVASYRFPTLPRIAASCLGLHRLPLMRRLVCPQPCIAQDVDLVPGCVLLARRTAVEEVGPLDESFFFYGEETDWCTRFRRAGWAVRYAPVGEVVHLGGASAAMLESRSDMLDEALVRLHRKHGGRTRASVVGALLGVASLGPDDRPLPLVPVGVRVCDRPG